MGLDDFTTESEPWEAYKKYNLTEKDKKLEDIVEELQELFPMHVRVDFIEASPAMDSTDGYAYYKDNSGNPVQYIRVAEKLVDIGGSKLRGTILHEMVHMLFYQEGYRGTNPHKEDISDGHPVFEWTLGAVGANISGVSTKGGVWTEVCEQFIEDGKGLKSTESGGAVVSRRTEDN